MKHTIPLLNNVLVSDREEVKDHARRGLLKFSFDMEWERKNGDTEAFEGRAENIVEELRKAPHRLGRALKFIERGHQEWKQSKDREEIRPPYHHLEPEVLDVIRRNAVYILSPLLNPDRGPAEVALFIHNSGFKTPGELIDVMKRLQFPVEAVRIIYPDSVAGEIKEAGTVYSRDVSPRNRPTDPVENLDPSKAPKVKVDTENGNIYQYRMYAYIGEINWKNEKQIDNENKILIDVDYSSHGIPGHSSPHYHVYR